MLKYLRHAIAFTIFLMIALYIVTGLMGSADASDNVGYGFLPIIAFVLIPLLIALLAIYIILSIYRRITTSETIEKSNRKPFLLTLLVIAIIFGALKAWLFVSAST